MRILISILLLCVSGIATQYDSLYKDPWVVGDSKPFNEVVVTRLLGVNSEKGVTNLCYETQAFLLKNLKELKKDGNITDDRFRTYTDKYKFKASGGMLHLYITRNDFDAGNMDYFYITITNKNGKEMYKQQYTNQVPRTNSDPEFMWMNEGVMMIMPDLYLPMTIEVYDKFHDETHRFKVEKGS